jgi:hypothetical protein
MIRLSVRGSQGYIVGGEGQEIRPAETETVVTLFRRKQDDRPRFIPSLPLHRE